jgi:hypothetical protein
MSQASCVWREACAFLNPSQYKLQFLIPFFSFFLYSSHWEIIRFGSSQSERGLQAQAAEKESQLFV